MPTMPEQLIPVSGAFYEAGCLVPCRLDQFMALWQRQLSRVIWQKSIRDGSVAVNDMPVVSPRHVLKKRDRVCILTMPVQAPAHLTAIAGNLDIRYEDRDILVVNKTPSLIVHPFPGCKDPCLVHYLLDHCQGRLAHADSCRPGILHRLDKDTSGLLIISKTDSAHTQLVRDMADHKIVRLYLALIYGQIDIPQRLKHFAAQDPRQIRRFIVHKTGRLMITDVLPLSQNSGSGGGARSVVACRLHTGRTHQIRLQLRAIGHPVIGDRLYGNHTRNMVPRQCLHASFLNFCHPVSKRMLTFIVPPPADFVQACRDQGLTETSETSLKMLIKTAAKRLTTTISPGKVHGLPNDGPAITAGRS